MRPFTFLWLYSVVAVSASSGYGAQKARPKSAFSPELLHLRRGDTSPITAQNASLVPPRRRPGQPKTPEDCPPCFNCLLPAFNCGNSGECNEYDGQCRCPQGFGGQDCLTPLCGALSDGDERYPRPEHELCKCKDGWGGINCNVCRNDDACSAFQTRFPGDDGTGSSSNETNEMVCYKGGLAIERNWQMCDVTNRKIIDTIPDNRPPQVTFSCSNDGPSSNFTSGHGWSHPLVSPLVADADPDGMEEKANGQCMFQFWVDRVESFYCQLDGCRWDLSESYNANETNYHCEKINCACIPGRFLCGEDGSVNIDEFLDQEVRGPGSFSCTSGKGCKFSEPAMNNLINDVFGDPAIFLDCDSGECLHRSQVPGYTRPAPPDNSRWVALSAAMAALIFVMACLALWYLGRTQKHHGGFSSIQLPEDEAAKLMADHVPATLHFNNISYTLPSGKPILSHVTGTVRPGELLAIMGASGAGKSTLLDILARKAKTGRIVGDMYINAREIPDEETFRRVVGYVDQEDTLLSTLTVYEAVLYSALLRLPRDMSYQAKVYRTLETMNELGILGIKDARIGESGKRSISGGEKRRVSIACELVTGPSILFLDEPTSGLDSYNAYNVVESLKTLAKTYNRTVIFTIHQPQSNIVALFDRLLLLAKGQLVYSGEASRAPAHFEKIGHECPRGYNIADYLIDLTVEASGDHRSKGKTNGSIAPVRPTPSTDRRDPENGFAARSVASGDDDESDGARKGDETVVGGIKRKAQKLLGAFSSPHTGSGSTTPDDTQVPEKLASLVLANRASDDAKIVEAEIFRIQSGNTPDGQESRNDARDLGEMRAYKKATYWTQFMLLSQRAFKNLYRYILCLNPLLMTFHYVMAVVVALICGFLFYGVTNDIPGFQNRLGLFLFILSLFGFSCLSSLGVFANERLLFMRERANGYYAPATYFLAKVLFDIIPLRVIPPFILGSIVYGLAGLNPEVSCFWKFIMILVLFNLTASSIVFFLSVAISDLGVANLVGSLVMLYNLLFAGLLMNYDKVPRVFRWMLTTSFFHAAYEALLVNELRYLQLIEHKFGLDIQVPSATILSSFGFHAQAFWWPDAALLAIVFGVFIVLSYLVLELFVKERR